ncbi:MAG: SiaB family protein kinase [Bacteroidales bacterium]
MKPPFLDDIYKIIKQDDLTLAYSGEFRDIMTDRIIELAEVYLESNNESTKLRRKTSFLVAECFQNVIRHGIKNPEVRSKNPQRTESFIIRFYDGKCYILSENTVVNEKVAELRGLLEDVNSLEQDNLRMLYRKMLEEGELSEKGGAGLGLFEMARRSGNKLHYSFKELDGGQSTFHLMLVLENVEKQHTERDYIPDFEQIEKVIRTLTEKDQFLIYHGELDQGMISPVSEIIERNLDAQKRPLALKIKFYHAVITILQFMGDYNKFAGKNFNSLLSLGITKEGYVIYSTLSVSDAIRERLEKELGKVRIILDDMKADKSGKEPGWDELLDEEDPISQRQFQLGRICKSINYNFHTTGKDTHQFNYEFHI